MAEDPRSDVELLAAAGAEPEALGRFYDRHEAGVIGYFMRRTHSAEVAAELTAETFANVVAHCRGGRRPVEAPAAWLYAIAFNELSTFERRGRVARHARRRIGLERVVLDDERLEQIEEAGSDGMARHVPDALASLSVEDRTAVLARHVDGLSYAEIATRQRTTEQVVRKRVSRALARLRTRLEESSS